MRFFRRDRRAETAVDAEDAFRRAVAAAEADPPDLEAAERWYRAALDGGEVNSANNLGNLLLRLERDDEAEQLYRRGIALGDEKASVNLAALLRDRHRDDEATDVLGEAARAGGFEAAEQLARTHYDAARYAESEHWFRRAAEDPGRRPAAELCVGVLAEARGEEVEAVDWYRRALDGGDEVTAQRARERLDELEAG